MQIKTFKTDNVGNDLSIMELLKVVRCKNCWKLGYDNCPMDDYFDSHPKEPDFFCAAGEPEEMRPRSACGPECGAELEERHYEID